jgi:sedoheptulokinase
VGDNQASVRSTVEDPDKDIALTLGTGGQLSIVLNKHPGKLRTKTAEVRPYLDSKFMVVAAVLCGGNAMKWVVKTTEDIVKSVGLTVSPKLNLYGLMNEQALRSGARGLVVRPSFAGERHDQSIRGEISGIDLENFTFGALAFGTAIGVLKNLKSMMPEEFLEGRTRVVGSGNAVRLNRFVQKAVAEVFGMPCHVTNRKLFERKGSHPEEPEEAARGAALIARDLAASSRI